MLQEKTDVHQVMSQQIKNLMHIGKTINTIKE
jgi:hypothetical protein